MLIIDVSEARSKPGELFTHHLTYLPEPDDADEEAKLLEPTSVEVQVSYSNGVFLVDTAVRMQLQLHCARCLEPFECQIKTRFSEEYGTAGNDTGESEEENVVVNDRIDLTERVRDTIIGSVPMKALCREDCPGLCAHCEVSPAEGPGDCSKDEIDPRMAGLARLLEGYKKKGVE